MSKFSAPRNRLEALSPLRHGRAGKARLARQPDIKKWLIKMFHG